MTGKILLVHKGWICLSRGTQILLQEAFVTVKNNYCVSQEEYFFWRRKIKNICSVTHTVLLLIGRTFPVLWQKKYEISHRRIFPVKVRIFLVTGNVLPVTGGKNNTLCHNTFFLWMKEFFLSLEINFLSQEEQRILCVTWRIFHGTGQAKQIIFLSYKFRYFRNFQHIW